MQISRRFTTAGHDPYENVEFANRTSRIVNPDGSVVFEARDIQMPAKFSQVATDIMAQKYFRKAGVPASTVRVAEDGVPEWLQRRVARTTRARPSVASPGRGRTGAGSTATSTPRRTRRLSTTSSPT